MFSVRTALVLCSLVIFCQACASTLRDVPRVKAREVPFQGFPVLTPPNLALKVLDERPEAMRVNQAELEKELTGVLSEVLRNGNLSVTDKAAQTLTVHVQAKDGRDGRKFDPERCVTLSARLERPDSFFVEAESMGCDEEKNKVGSTMGGNISEAYRVAMGKMLQELRQQLGGIPPGAFEQAPPKPEPEAPETAEATADKPEDAPKHKKKARDKVTAGR
jgi:hypothetical protein